MKFITPTPGIGIEKAAKEGLSKTQRKILSCLNIRTHKLDFSECSIRIKQETDKHTLLMQMIGDDLFVSMVYTTSGDFNEYCQHINKPLLTCLDLSSNAIYVIPKILLQFQWIRSLIIRSNHIHEIPTFLTKLAHLEDLDISDNRIRDVNPALLQKENFRKLCVSNNRNVVLPVNAGSNLKVLRLANVGRTTWPYDIRRQKNLTLLDLSMNRLVTINIKMLKEMGKLEFLLLKDNVIKEELYFKDFTSLYIVDLSGNKLNKTPYFSNCPNLTQLFLQGNYLEYLQLWHFRETNLLVLDVANNRIKRVFYTEGDINSLTIFNLSYNLIERLPGNLVEFCEDHSIMLNMKGNPYLHSYPHTCGYSETYIVPPLKLYEYGFGDEYSEAGTESGTVSTVDSNRIRRRPLIIPSEIFKTEIDRPSIFTPRGNDELPAHLLICWLDVILVSMAAVMFIIIVIVTSLPESPARMTWYERFSAALERARQA